MKVFLEIAMCDAHVFCELGSFLACYTGDLIFEHGLMKLDVVPPPLLTDIRMLDTLCEKH